MMACSVFDLISRWDHWRELWGDRLVDRIEALQRNTFYQLLIDVLKNVCIFSMYPPHFFLLVRPCCTAFTEWRYNFLFYQNWNIILFCVVCVSFFSTFLHLQWLIHRCNNVLCRVIESKKVKLNTKKQAPRTKSLHTNYKNPTFSF